MTFIVESFKTTIDGMWNVNSNPWIYATAIICILTPMAWERNIAKFAFSYVMGVIFVVWATLVVTGYCFGLLYNNPKLGPNIEAINEKGYLTTLGMCIYSFEGIGVVMPIMHACDSP